ncbi:unnamed protein product [Paramecium octaurelia]|uniref:Uncharacterized protein n=1 Tax=Paramecium octaurelia TaxID=43137 RepID=A0A8S1XEA8_PAROT|nr:unnamed protein product [Paramecium octaurelia]
MRTKHCFLSIIKLIRLLVQGQSEIIRRQGKKQQIKCIYLIQAKQNDFLMQN